MWEHEPQSRAHPVCNTEATGVKGAHSGLAEGGARPMRRGGDTLRCRLSPAGSLWAPQARNPLTLGPSLSPAVRGREAFGRTGLLRVPSVRQCFCLSAATGVSGFPSAPQVSASGHASVCGPMGSAQAARRRPRELSGRQSHCPMLSEGPFGTLGVGGPESSQSAVREKITD